MMACMNGSLGEPKLTNESATVGLATSAKYIETRTAESIQAWHAPSYYHCKAQGKRREVMVFVVATSGTQDVA